MKKGFTLIEILVAMSILVIVIASTLAIFRASARSWQKGEVRALRYQAARFILDKMSREISSLVPTSLAGPYCLGTKERFYFISALPDAPTALIEVGYWLNAEAQELMRSYQLSPDYDFSTYDEEELFSENITALNFRYFTGESWLESWDARPGGMQDGQLPKAVKLEFTLQDERGKQQETFSTVVTVASAQE